MSVFELVDNFSDVLTNSKDVIRKSHTENNTSPLFLEFNPSVRDQSRQSLQQTLAELGAQYGSISQLIQVATSVQGILEDERARLQNISNPVAAVPTELLQNIFMRVVHDTGKQDQWEGYRTTAKDLSHVCSRWRAAALSFSSLWTKVVTSYKFEAFQMHAARSAHHPFELDIVIPSEDKNAEKPPLDSSIVWELAHMKESFARVKALALDVHAGRYGMLQALKDASLPLPRMERLTLRGKGLWGPDSMPFGWIQNPLLLSQLPLLNYIFISAMRPCDLLITFEFGVLAKISELHISACFMSMPCWIAIHVGFRSLRHLHLTNVKNDPADRPPSLGFANLPGLEYIEVSNCDLSVMQRVFRIISAQDLKRIRIHVEDVVPSRKLIPVQFQNATTSKFEIYRTTSAAQAFHELLDKCPGLSTVDISGVAESVLQFMQPLCWPSKLLPTRPVGTSVRRLSIETHYLNNDQSSCYYDLKRSLIITIATRVIHTLSVPACMIEGEGSTLRTRVKNVCITPCDPIHCSKRALETGRWNI